MKRPLKALGIGFCSLALMLAALAVPAFAHKAGLLSPGPADYLQQRTNPGVWLSAARDGQAQRNFRTGARLIYAVIDYTDLERQHIYKLQVTDPTGTVGYLDTSITLSGSGRHNVALTVDRFVAAYVSDLQGSGPTPGLVEQARQLVQGAIDRFDDGVPPPGTERQAWLQQVLNQIASARQTGAASSQTIDSLLSFPELGATPRQELQASRARVGEALADLDAAQQALRPPVASPTPTSVAVATPPAASASSSRPNMAARVGHPTASLAQEPEPDFTLAEQKVRAAHDRLRDAHARALAGVGAVGDTSNWAFPPTLGQVVDGRLVSCPTYTAQLWERTAQGENVVTHGEFTIGNPGLPAMVFPDLDSIKPANQGQVGIAIPPPLVPGGRPAVYAGSVDVEDANHSAVFRAAVTDDGCLVVDGALVTWEAVTRTMTQTLPAGTVNPRQVLTVNGMVTTAFEAGMEPSDHAFAVAKVFTAGGSPEQPPLAVGEGSFAIVGPPYGARCSILTNVRRSVPVKVEQGISVLVRDRFSQDVADGTRVTLSLSPSSTLGVLVYYDSDPGGDCIRFETNSVELVTFNGIARRIPARPGGWCRSERGNRSTQDVSVRSTDDAPFPSNVLLVATATNGERWVHPLRFTSLADILLPYTLSRR